MSEGRAKAGEEMAGGGRAGGQHMLVISRRSWLVSSLEEILAEIGMEVVRARSREEAMEEAGSHEPAIVLVDHGVEANEENGADLCRELAKDYLAPSVPIILYTSSAYARAEVHTEALDAGAWTILREPLEASPLLALIRRLLRVSELITLSRAGADLVDAETGLLTLAGLRRVLPSLGALAVRNQVPVSFVVVAPTGGNHDPALRRRTAALCSPNVRSADLCAWVNGDELAIVAYDTPAEGARQLVKRLNEMAKRAAEQGDDGLADDLSAGIVELGPRNGLQEAVDVSRRSSSEERTVPLAEFQELYSLSAAQAALDEARRAGGGVQVASVA